MWNQSLEALPYVRTSGNRTTTPKAMKTEETTVPVVSILKNQILKNYAVIYNFYNKVIIGNNLLTINLFTILFLIFKENCLTREKTWCTKVRRKYNRVMKVFINYNLIIEKFNNKNFSSKC